FLSLVPSARLSLSPFLSPSVLLVTTLLSLSLSIFHDNSSFSSTLSLSLCHTPHRSDRIAYLCVWWLLVGTVNETRMCGCVGTSVCVGTSLCVCGYKCVCGYAFVCVWVYVCVWLCGYVYVWVRVGTSVCAEGNVGVHVS